MQQNKIKTSSYLHYLQLALGLVCLAFGGGIPSVQAQVPADYSILLQTEAVRQPAAIRLKWQKRGAPPYFYRLQRKLFEASSWQNTPVIEISAKDSTYLDTSKIEIGVRYEYRIVKMDTSKKTILAYGYATAGIDLPLTEDRKGVILLVDKTAQDSLATEINQWMQDVSTDGFKVLPLVIEKNTASNIIRDKIRAIYRPEPDLWKYLFILGGITVPYSGLTGPDGHPDHMGAWPADVYYGEMDENWFDTNVNDTSATRKENRNIPKDGKWDNIRITNAEIAVGRVDMRKMINENLSEIALLRQYLNKTHAFRTGNTQYKRQAIIDDNFGNYGSSGDGKTPFSSSGWRNFGSMFGDTNIITGDYLTDGNKTSFLFGYGCGAGNYSGCNGVGTTSDYLKYKPAIAFNFLFGSYFGDWDVEHSFLRAPLASGDYGLTSAWAGRPYWIAHPMASGSTIGEITLMTQNNQSRYPTNYNERGVTVALMGDPTLRLHVVTPPQNLKANFSLPNNVKLTWQALASIDTTYFKGYKVYRWNKNTNQYLPLHNQLITQTEFTDTLPLGMQTNHYCVKAITLEKTAGGNYFNSSLGIRDSVFVPVSRALALASMPHFELLPNPAVDYININFASNGQNDISGIQGAFIEILDLNGKVVRRQKINSSEIRVDVHDLSNGTYLAQIKYTDANELSQKSAAIKWIKLSR